MRKIDDVVGDDEKVSPADPDKPFLMYGGVVISKKDKKEFIALLIN